MLVVIVPSRDHRHVVQWWRDGWGRVSVQHLLLNTWFYFLNFLSGDNHILAFILTGVAVVAAVAVVVGVFLYRKRNGEWIKLSRRTDTWSPPAPTSCPLPRLWLVVFTHWWSGCINLHLWMMNLLQCRVLRDVVALRIWKSNNMRIFTTVTTLIISLDP